MSAPKTNTNPRAAVALIALALVLSTTAGALIGCGGGSSNDSAQALLNDTFRSGPSVQSGQVSLALALSGGGGGGHSGLGAPVAIHLSGPFQGVGSGALPSFDLKLGLQAGGRSVQAGAVSTDHQFFLELEGSAFAAPRTYVQTLERSYAQQAHAAGSSGGSSFAALGIDPSRWLVHPVKAGTASIGGESTIHVVAGVEVANFLRDAQRLARAGGSLGLGATQSGALSPAGIEALAGAVRNATADVYTGASDHLLRRLQLRASLVSTPATSGVLQGLRSATLALDVELSQLNRPQRIAAPTSARPMSELTASLSGSGTSEAQAGASGAASSSTGAASSSTGAGQQLPSSQQSPVPGGPSQAYLDCAARAGRSVRELQACAPLLH
ncbi:MAG: hypothetical protein FWD42_02295 [Solirubrobacterales bacterium]|nr:hypothetical protein [Solirubrobacterales bacterium]